MPAGDKNDPYLRTWLRVLTQDLSDPAYTRLSSSERGVLVDLERYSLRSSDIPGHFLYDGKPLPIGDILRGIAPRDVDQDETNRAAMQSLRENGWLTYDEDDGWTLPKWSARQLKTIVEPESARRARELATNRQRRKRAAEASGEPVELEGFRKGKQR